MRPCRRVTLVTGFPQSGEKIRDQEYDLCLSANVDNGFISRVVILEEEPGSRAAGQWTRNRKVTIKKIGKRATYQDYVDAANYECGAIVIANADIRFDWSVSKLTYTPTETLLSITRADLLPNLPYYIASSDAWAFVPRMEVKGCDWVLGRCGCEFAFNLEVVKQLGWKLWNPCYEVRLFHAHNSGVYSPGHDDWIKSSKMPIPKVARFAMESMSFSEE